MGLQALAVGRGPWQGQWAVGSGWRVRRGPRCAPLRGFMCLHCPRELNCVWSERSRGFLFPTWRLL